MPSPPPEGPVPLTVEAGGVRGTLWWTAGGEAELAAGAARLGVPLRLERGEAAPLPPGPDAVLYRDAAHAALAASYAATVGARCAPASPEAVAAARAGGGRALLLADLPRTPLAELERLGCAPWSPAWAGTAVLQVDDRAVGTAHLLKNLLARAGLLPPYAGTLAVAPELSAAPALEGPRERVLLAAGDGAAARAALTAPHRHLLLSAHSNPLNAGLGALALCSNCGPDGAVAPAGSNAGPGDRVLPCFHTGECVMEGVDHRLPPEAVAARHVFWSGCNPVTLSDSVYHHATRGVMLQMLGGPHVVSMIVPLRAEHGGAGDVLNALFALDGRITLDALRETASGYGAAAYGSPTAFVLLGDPRLEVGGQEPCSGAAPAVGADARVSLPAGGPARVRVRLPAGARVAVQPEPGRATLLGSTLRGGDGEGELQLLAVPRGTEPVEAVRLRPLPPLDPWLRRLRAWTERARFWRAVAMAVRGWARGHDAALAGDCDTALDLLAGLEDAALRSLAAARRAARQAADLEGLVAAPAAALPALVQALQPRLMDLALRYDGGVPLWTPSFVAGPRRPSGARCACGAACTRVEYRAAGGRMRRRVLSCPRCGRVAEHEAGTPRPRLSIPGGAADAGGRVRAVLAGVGESALLEAALRPQPGATRAVTLARVPGEGGALELALQVPWRGATAEAVHVFALEDLAWSVAIAWYTRDPLPPAAPEPAGFMDYA